jgi:hypothetical protein
VRNVFLGYFFARAVSGERAARAAVLIVAVLIGLLLLSIGASTVDLFRQSFVRGIRDGLRRWDRAEHIHRQ